MLKKQIEKKFPMLMRKYLPLWVILAISLGLLVGYYTDGAETFKPVIPFLLFVMLYPMMINLRVEDIARALKDPKLFLIAIIMNFLLTPLMGALWTRVLFHQADPYLAVGFILKVTVPCSGMVAAWTGYAKGRVESALVIVASSLVLSIFLVPFWMWALAGIYVSISPYMIFKTMILIVVLPLLAGLPTRKLLVRKYGQQGYKMRIAPYFPAVSTCGMLTMVFIIISSQAKLIVGNPYWMFLIIMGIATLYPLLFVLAVLFSRLMHMDYGNGMALGYSVTAKAHAITIGVATTAFAGTLAVLPAAVAPIVQIPIMMAILKASGLIQRFLGFGNDASRQSHSIVSREQKKM